MEALIVVLVVVLAVALTSKEAFLSARVAMLLRFSAQAASFNNHQPASHDYTITGSEDQEARVIPKTAILRTQCFNNVMVHELCL